MAEYVLNILQVDKSGLAPATVNKLVKLLHKELGKDAEITYSKKVRAESRADRLAEAMSGVSDAKSEVEELKGELETWRESLPENLQQSQKAEELDTAISALEDLQNDLEQLEGKEGDVDFPSMM